MRLDDGTVSDGKVDTYVQCVERILGSAETFFTSVFAAQGRRQLSAYKNGEIKTLLADLLGLDEIRAVGAKALETAKFLKAGLVAVRQESTGRAAQDEQVTREPSQRRHGGAATRGARPCVSPWNAMARSLRFSLSRGLVRRSWMTRSSACCVARGYRRFHPGWSRRRSP